MASEIATLNVKPPAMRVYSNSASLMDVISRAAADPSVDVNKMHSLLEMHERLSAKEAQQAFNLAMKDAQATMRTIGVDKSNSSTKSKYASYAKLDSVVRPIYSPHGFALSFDTGEGAPENFVRVLCHVSHDQGHTKTYHVDMPADGKGAKGGDVMTRTHATGSALTYGKRYLLILIFNLAIGEEDDDGNAADPATAGAQDTINEQQKKRILELIAETKADVKKLCTYFEIAEVEELPAKKFFKAVDTLKAFAQQQAKKAKP